MDGTAKVRVMTIIVDAEDDSNIRIIPDNLGGDPMFGKNEVEFLRHVLEYCEEYSKKLEAQFGPPEKRKPMQGWEQD